MRSPRPRLAEALAAVTLLLLFAFAAGAALRADASVADEHPHILSGWLYWKSGRFAGGFDNPPLGQLWLTAALAGLGRDYRFPSDAHLGLCRLPVLLLALGLGVVLWRWGRALAGRRGGLMALAGFCLEPNLLAHGHLATLDLPVTALWWGALWAWRSGLEPESHRHSAVLFAFVLLFAAATLTKFTGFFLLPAVWLATWVARPYPGSGRRAAATVLAALAVLFVAAHIAYGFASLRHGLPAPLWAGLEGKLAHRDEVRFAYLAGRRSATGFLAYYPVALLLKTPLPLLILAGVGGAVLLRRRRRTDLALLVIPALAVVVAFTWIRVNVGVRHVLPVYPALLLGAAVGADALWRRGWRERAAVVLLGLAWVGGVARVAPQWLAYFNVVAGGPAGGHRWLLDSNLDWGQDDRRLEQMTRSHPELAAAVDPDPEVPRTGAIAVSANALHNLQRRSDRPYAWLRDLEPVGFAGYSWRLYELREIDFAAQARRHPDSPAAQAAYAEILARRGAAAPAREVLAGAAARLNGRSDFVALAAFAAAAAARRADWAEALDWTRRGLAVRPEDLELQGVAHEYELESQRVAVGDSAAAARLDLERGLWRAETGRVEAALPLLRRAAAGLPDDAEAQRNYAVALAQRGEYAAAAEVLGQAVSRGRYPEEEKLCTTLAAAQAALASGAAVPAALLRELGQSAFESGRYDAAAAAFVEALRTNPEESQALAYLGEMQVRSKMRIVPERLTPRAVTPRRPPPAAR